jgi:hypothetical protein
VLLLIILESIGKSVMKYIPEIQASINSPDQLESLYQVARQANEEPEFRSDLQEMYQKSPNNILLLAWHSRFDHFPLPKPKRATNWGLAVVLGIVTGLILWAISNPQWIFLDQIPYILVLWSPIATIPAIIFLAIISKRNYQFAAISVIGLIIASIYVLLIAPGQSHSTGRDYLILMVIQLPLLCWFALGIAVMKFKSTAGNRFAFLTKSIEIMITAGVYLIFGVAFGLITVGMFAALNVTPPDIIMRLIIAGGFGLIPIMAVATMYDPLVLPEFQDFNQGLSKFVFTMMRLLLPLTLVVLIIYLFVIPFNFTAPYQNRNLLIVYNVMQFAIIGLLIGATPLKLDDLSPKMQVWLRRGIIAVSILAIINSLYALSAVVYRTVLDGITLNRTTIIGWNIINIAILGFMLYTQFTKGIPGWHARLQNIFSKATAAYLIWSVFLILALPLIFR